MLDRGNTAAAETFAPPAIPLAQRWEQLKPLLQREAGDNNFRSWIIPIAPLSFAGGVLELGVPTRFMRDWVRTHYADRIRALWAQHFGAPARVEIVIAEKAAAAEAVAYTTPVVANDAGTDNNEDRFSSPLDPRYTFDNFVTDPSNALAAGASRKLAESDMVPFNPLYIHGGVGLGKTHLMQAAAQVLRARKPSAKIVYMSAERFMYQFVQALRGKDTMTFKSFFRSVDVLMIDDIQFICGKESTQDEFLHTFNSLLDHGKQVVVSADRAPAELDGIGERLRSRLGMGLAARIEPTTYELRLAVLRSKCGLLKRDIPQDVLELLAAKITSNVRELEGALNRLIAHAELADRPVTLETAQALLQDLLKAGDRRVSVEEIQKKVADYYGLRLADMHSPRRARPLARPRQVAMYLCKIMTEHSLPDIGRKFGGRDHTTIIHGIRRIEELMTTDADMARDVEILKRAVAG